MAIDGAGRPYIPGTTIAGALRAWTDTQTDRSEMWGFSESGSLAVQASRLMIADAAITAAPVTDDDGEPIARLDTDDLHTYTGTGIDRFTRAAAAGVLYEHAVAPKGCFLRLVIEVDAGRDTLDADRTGLTVLLQALADGLIHVGASTGSGLGRVRLITDTVSVTEDDFTHRAGLIATLRDTSPAWNFTEFTERHPPSITSTPTLAIRIAWNPASPVMSAADTPGSFVDVLPRIAADTSENVRLLLPGRSIRGALRSHSERIVRTVANINSAPPRGDVPAQASKFRADHTALPIVNALFGAARRSGSQIGRGALKLDDCLSHTTIDRGLWQRLYLDADSDPQRKMPDDLRDLLAEIGFEQAHHTAIDRWTGSPADGIVYSILEPHGVRWSDIKITVDISRLNRTAETVSAEATLALLLLLMRDMRDGLIPLGYGMNRGMGSITVTSITITSQTWPGGVDLDVALRSPQASVYADAWRLYIGRLQETTHP